MVLAVSNGTSKDVSKIKNLPENKILVTNSVDDFALKVIKHLKINKYFSEIYSADDFSDKAEFVDLGGGASQGLTHFKMGWTNQTRPTYLCGRIYDQRSYENLEKESGIQNPGFFPGYRSAGFG